MSESAYSITVTPEGVLLVNDSPVNPPEGGDWLADDRLRWALDQVAAQHRQIGGSLRLTITDQRDGGYGTNRTLLQPGQTATLDSLRRASGRDLSAWAPHETPPAQEPESLHADEARPPAEQDSINTEAERQDSVPVGHHASATSPATAEPAPPPPTLPSSPDDDEHGLATPSRRDEVTEARQPISSPSPPPPHEDAGLHVVTPPPVQTPPRPPMGSQKAKRQPKAPKKPKVKKAEEKDDQPQRPSNWTVYTPTPGTERPVLNGDAGRERDRPVVTGGVSRRMVALIVVAVAVVATFIAFSVARAQFSVAHVAVCVDQRSSARVAPDSVCDDPANGGYLHWWYVPSGEFVPGVGGAIDPAAGSFTKPGEKAPVTYGYDPAGGTFQK